MTIPEILASHGIECHREFSGYIGTKHAFNIFDVTGIKSALFTLYIDNELIFTRGRLHTVIAKLKERGYNVPATQCTPGHGGTAAPNGNHGGEAPPPAVVPLLPRTVRPGHCPAH